ncbi:P-II family nitrogen regulator [Alphaproteobacteria bacterium]|nr:P-II family nitrogen regulator [Alphaproteobacteria bacterium]
MKKIEAIIKPLKLSAVKEALHEIGLSGMTILDVKGFGRQRGQDGGIEKESAYSDEFHAKIKIELIVDDEMILKAMNTIKEASYTGKIGDGKIFVSPIEQVLRIRTGEKDSEAV